MRRIALFALLVACGGPPRVEEKIVTSITGRVLDGTSQQPVANALVQTEPFVKQAFTNAMGQFSIEDGLTVGMSYRVTASRDGYDSNSLMTAAIVEGTNTVADIVLPKKGPKLGLSTTTVQIGAGSSAGLFVVSNDGDEAQPLMFNVASGEGWVSQITPTSGNVTSIDETISVRIDRTMLPAGAGDVTGSVVVSSNGGSGTVTLRVVR